MRCRVNLLVYEVLSSTRFLTSKQEPGVAFVKRLKDSSFVARVRTFLIL